jgi:predicted MPP superfamily phosphohydrolase
VIPALFAAGSEFTLLLINAVFFFLLPLVWVGHAALWTYLLNNLYGRRISKRILKPFRLFVGSVIVSFPALFLSAVRVTDFDPAAVRITNGDWGIWMFSYLYFCEFVGVYFVWETVLRLLRRTPAAVLAESTRTLDLWPEHGHKLIGDGLYSWVPRLPFNCVFKVDFTELTLAVRDLPPAWDGLTILQASDFHFHGTPSELFFARVIDEITKQPPADVVALPGDFLDANEHHHWIPELLGRLRWNECGLAILGNHDVNYKNGPDRTREELAKLGYRVLTNRWEEVTIRGVPCVAAGHEGPWTPGAPDLSTAPAGRFRLCLSHTPDNFYWGIANRVNLMLCGHVHGGQIRLPVIGSIFVPSIYSRRFDMGVFEQGGTVMVTSRGVSGKEPLRFRCHPEVIRITLRAAPA